MPLCVPVVFPVTLPVTLPTTLPFNAPLASILTLSKNPFAHLLLLLPILPVLFAPGKNSGPSNLPTLTAPAPRLFTLNLIIRPTWFVKLT